MNTFLLISFILSVIIIIVFGIKYLDLYAENMDLKKALKKESNRSLSDVNKDGKVDRRDQSAFMSDLNRKLKR